MTTVYPWTSNRFSALTTSPQLETDTPFKKHEISNMLRMSLRFKDMTPNPMDLDISGQLKAATMQDDGGEPNRRITTREKPGTPAPQHQPQAHQQPQQQQPPQPLRQQQQHQPQAHQQPQQQPQPQPLRQQQQQKLPLPPPRPQEESRWPGQKTRPGQQGVPGPASSGHMGNRHPVPLIKKGASIALRRISSRDPKSTSS
jgi:outer membrane biosynthesis protein TonB